MLDLSQAVKLLTLPSGRSGVNPKDSTLVEIVEAVGRLPLALEMLAVRLNDAQNPTRLLREIRESPTPAELEVFQKASNTTIPRAESVFAAIAGTLADLPNDVRKRLAPVGYVADVPISTWFLAELFSKRDIRLYGLNMKKFDRLVDECRRRSVMSSADGYVVVHSLTIAVIAATNSNGIIAKISRRAKRQASKTVWRTVGRLMEMTGAGFWALVNPNKAQISHLLLMPELAHYRQILDRAKDVLGEGNTSVLRLAHEIAYANYFLRHYEDAVKLQKETLDIHKRKRGPEHRGTLNIQRNLAGYYHMVGRHEDAVELQEETLIIHKRVRGLEHRETLKSQGDLAHSYYNAGHYEKAIKLNEETLKIHEQVLGFDNIFTLRRRDHLAIYYRAVGRHEEAIKLQEKTHYLWMHPTKASKRRKGLNRDSLKSCGILASLYQCAGRYEEAIMLYEDNLSAMEQLMGPQHPDTLTYRHGLACSYHAIGRYKDAVKLDEETLSARERVVLGAEHPDTLQSRNNLAAGYHQLGRYDEAIQLHEQNLKIYERLLGPEHPETINIRSNLAEVYRSARRDDQDV